MCRLGYIYFISYYYLFRIIRASFNLQNDRRCSYRICGAWVISFIVTSPYSYYLSYNSKYKTCLLLWSADEQLIFSGLFVAFTNVLPILILIVLHTLSVIELKRSVQECKADFTKRRRKQIRHITNMFSLITCTFFLSTAPYMCLYLNLAYNRKHRIPIKSYHYYMHYGLYFMSCLNYIVNPYFYAHHFNIRKWVRTIRTSLRSYRRSTIIIKGKRQNNSQLNTFL